MIIVSLVDRKWDAHLRRNILFIKAIRTGNIGAVKDLISKGADKDEKIDKGNTPLIVAVGTNQPEIVRFLVQQGVDLDKDTTSRTNASFLQPSKVT